MPEDLKKKVEELDSRVKFLEAAALGGKTKHDFAPQTVPPVNSQTSSVVQYEYQDLFPALKVIVDPAYSLLLHLMHKEESIKVNHSLLAREAGCKIDEAKSEIKAKTGKTFKQIQKDFVLDQIKRDLLETFESISEIADYYGYPDQQYMTNNFKKKYGLPPAKYREKYTKSKK